MQNSNTPPTQNEGEHILFYGEFASISADTQMKGGAIDSSLLLKAVEEHRDDTYLTVMDTDYISLNTELKQEVTEINPHTQFVQVHNLGEFTEYYDRGMDRELHPVESVTTIESVMFYDTIEKEQPKVKTEVEEPREYIKATEISSNEMMNDLQSQLNTVIHLKGQEFLDFMGLKDDVESLGTESMINLAKSNLKNEFFKDYALPQAGKTAVDSIEKVIPSMPAKSIKEGVLDGIEFVYDMVGDKDRGHLKIEYDCKSLSDCHIKGVYREYENEQTKEASSEKTVDDTKEANVSTQSVTLENNSSKPHNEIASLKSQEEQDNRMDTTQKSQEIVANMDLSQYDNSMDNGMEIA